MLPLISVIVPTYNRQNTIKRSIDSILCQDYSNIELIVVDDRSSDDTKGIIDGYNDRRIKYIYNELGNHGAGAARNIGIEIATGEYIAFNDSDDEWIQGKLTSQYNFLTKNRADITFCLMELNGMILPSRFTSKKCTLEYILRGNIPGPQTILGRKECFQNVKFDEKMKSFEDNDWLIRLFEKYKICFQNKVYVHMYSSENSVSSNSELNIDMLNYILNKHKSLYNLYPTSQKAIKSEMDYIQSLIADRESRNYTHNRRELEYIINTMTKRCKRYMCVIKMLRYR